MSAIDNSLKKLLDNCLQCDIPEDQEQALKRLLPATNLDILEKSLKELRGVAKKQNQTDLLSRLHKVYHRKLKEQAALYPAFHVFETSFRAFLAHWLEDHYQTDKWWEPELTRLQNQQQQRPTEINGTPITHGISRAIENFILHVNGDDLGRQTLQGTTTFNVFNMAKLSDLEKMIHEHWPHIKSNIAPNYGTTHTVTKENFSAKFKHVRDARNTSFHHREVSHRPRLLEIVEELLDLIDVHLDSYLDNMHHISVKKNSPKVALCERHRTIKADHKDFRISYRQKDQQMPHTVIKATCSGEAMTKFMLNLEPKYFSDITHIAALPPIAFNEG